MGWEAEPGWTFRGREREIDILPVPKIEPCFRRQDHVPFSADLWEIKRDSVGTWHASVSSTCREEKNQRFEFFSWWSF
jgi:hypothetical protein